MKINELSRSGTNALFEAFDNSFSWKIEKIDEQQLNNPMPLCAENLNRKSPLLYEVTNPALLLLDESQAKLEEPKTKSQTVKGVEFQPYDWPEVDEVRPLIKKA